MDSQTAANGAGEARSPAGWRAALMLACAGLVPLCWLLARLIWLPLYMGLFFFIIAGLLVGAVSFRLAARSRPLSRGRIIRGAAFAALVGGVAFVIFEYLNFAGTVGEPPRFAEAKNAAILAGRTARGVEQAAALEFRTQLAARHAPGGVIGYIRWSIGGGELPIVVNGAGERIGNPHAGFPWIIRTLAAVALMGLGAYLSYDALRFGQPVSNIIAPGEPYEEEV